MLTPVSSAQASHADGGATHERSIAALGRLANEYKWATVLELSTSLLADYEQDASPRANAGGREGGMRPDEMLACAMYRAIALLQTRQVERAADALGLLGSLESTNAAYRYESHTDVYGAEMREKGSFVPFELQVLDVEIRARQGDKRCVTDAYAMIGRLDGDDERTVERKCVLLSAIASYHLRDGEHDAAVDACREMVRLKKNGAEMYYMYARVLLHVGNLEEAERVLDLADGQKDGTKAGMHLHRGMLQGGRCRFEEALVEYERAIAAEEEEREKGVEQGGKCLWVCALNNAAICLMHVGRLAEGIDRLEECLRRDAESALDEGVVFNLCTLYDLAYPDSSNEKKRVLQRLASRFGRQGFDLNKVTVP